MTVHFHSGRNAPGFLPDGFPHISLSFTDAHRSLLHDLKFAEEYAVTEGEAENLSAAAEDVNLWAESDLRLDWEVAVADGTEHGLGQVFWIRTCTQHCDMEDDATVTAT